MTIFKNWLISLSKNNRHIKLFTLSVILMSAMLGITKLCTLPIIILYIAIYLLDAIILLTIMASIVKDTPEEIMQNNKLYHVFLSNSVFVMMLIYFLLHLISPLLSLIIHDIVSSFITACILGFLILLAFPISKYFKKCCQD